MAAPAEPRICSMARTLDVVGEKWALLAVREVFLGNRRFDAIVRKTGAPRETMTARLRTLVEAGVLERRQYSDHPPRFEYHLTAAGRDLHPVILTLLRWGDEHLAGTEGPPVILEHHTPEQHASHRLVPEVTCRECGEPVEAIEVVRKPQRQPA